MKYIVLFLLINININAVIIPDSTSDTIVDTKTNLMWQDTGETETEPKTWIEAINYCENLTLVSKSDWRLPNINELNTIVDDTKYSPALDNKFSNAKNDNYWSSTTSLYSNTSYAWIINFDSGANSYKSKTNSAYKRCVRNLN